MRPNGVLYFWHNDMLQIAKIMAAIEERTRLVFRDFCIWHKPKNRTKAFAWANPSDKNTLRSWYPVCEYCLRYERWGEGAGDWANRTGLANRAGLAMINSSPECYKPLKEWYRAECDRLGLTQADIAAAYTEVTGKKPHMLRHYFQDSQFEMPTREVWDAVYRDRLGFRREYEDLRREYEDLRREYEDLRPYHKTDPWHCNVWTSNETNDGKLHACRKPVNLLRRLVRVSCRPGGTVLDCFMGSGSTGEAAVMEGRRFIGIERDPKCFEIAGVQIAEAYNQLSLFALPEDEEDTDK